MLFRTKLIPLVTFFVTHRSAITGWSVAGIVLISIVGIFILLQSADDYVESSNVEYAEIMVYYQFSDDNYYYDIKDEIIKSLDDGKISKSEYKKIVGLARPFTINKNILKLHWPDLRDPNNKKFDFIKRRLDYNYGY